MVLDRSSVPQAQVSVILRSALGSAELVTDASGEAAFRGIAGGAYTLSLNAPSGPELASANQIPLEDGDDQRLVVRLGGFDQTISGRILDRNGAPVPGVEVEAVSRFFQKNEVAVIRVDLSTQGGVSDTDGFYEIGGLAEGREYEVRTVATGTLRSTKKVVRAGTKSAHLVVDRGRPVTVYGQVRAAEGRPLKGVNVSAVGQIGQQSVTGEDGRYSLEFSVTGWGLYSVHFSLAGYRDASLNIPGAHLQDVSEWKLDAELEPVGLTVAVSGTITAADGTPLAGETVYLRSSSRAANLKAVSNEGGQILFPELEVAEDYRLWVYPKGNFKDFALSPLAVPKAGLEVSVVLEPLKFGRVRGVMIDPGGNPVPRFSLWARSRSAVGKTVLVTGDGAGRFQADSVPEGELSFETKALPRLAVRGLHLAPGADTEVRLTIDWGTYEISGSAVDEEDTPIAAARVRLYWNRQEGGIESSSYRDTVTDEAGRFTLTQLGRGEHRLHISSPGYEVYETRYDPGGTEAFPTVRLSLSRR